MCENKETRQELKEKMIAAVDEKHIVNIITNVEYKRMGTKTTICCLTAYNGYEVVGFSSCIDANKYVEEEGRAIAYENAFALLRELEIYKLHSDLTRVDFEDGDCPHETEACGECSPDCMRFEVDLDKVLEENFCPDCLNPAKTVIKLDRNGEGICSECEASVEVRECIRCEQHKLIIREVLPKDDSFVCEDCWEDIEKE